MKNRFKFLRWLFHTTTLIVLIFMVFTFVFEKANNVLSKKYENGYDTNLDFFNYGEMVAALIGAFLVVIQLRNDADVEKEENLIQQSQFITDYNNYFLSNEEMTAIEADLEHYYTSFADCRKGDRSIDLNGEYRRLSASFSDSGTPERQRLINYLVYLEGIATVITNHSMNIENVDSLFGYRFFIAVNNPVVQELELIPFGIHYRGIYWLYNEWVKYRKQKWKTVEKYMKMFEYDENFIKNYENYGIPLQNKECALSKTENFKAIVSMHLELTS